MEIVVRKIREEEGRVADTIDDKLNTALQVHDMPVEIFAARPGNGNSARLESEDLRILSRRQGTRC